MISSSAALPVVFGEQLPERPSEQRQVVDQEQRSAQRSEGRPEYSGASRVRLHPHRAPITATRLTGTHDTGIRVTPSRAMETQAIRDTLPTAVFRAMDTQVIRVSPAMDIRATRKGPLTPVSRALDIPATRALPVMPVPRAMGTRADLGSRITPLLPAMDIPANQNIPLTSVRRDTDTKPSRAILVNPTHRPMNTRVMRDTRHTPILQATYHRSI